MVPTELTIYHKNGTAFSSIKEFDFNSQHMGESKVTATVYAASKIEFKVDDYLTLFGNKYYLPEEPVATKTARTGEGIGDALQYDLEFFSEANRLKDILFQDYVSKDDTEQYYTGTATFDFYNNVTELAIRLQANLDRFFGSGIWTVIVSDLIEILEEKQVSVNEQYLWDGLEMVSSVYGLDFFISGTNILIGGSGTELPITLYYGKNKGLYEIQRTFSSENKVITRLKTYGASRNLPPDYLRDENAKGRYFTKLMLPNFATTGIDYVDASPAMIEKYGIIEGVKTFEDVYPSIEEIDLGSGRIDEIVSVDPIDPDSDYFTVYFRDLGFDINDYLTSETPRISIKGSNVDGTPTYLGGYEFTIVEVSGTRVTLQKNQADGVILPDSVTTVRVGDRFVLLGIFMPQSYITNAENKLFERANAYFTDEGGVDVTYDIKADEIFIVNNSLEESFVVGDKIKIEDDDLEVANYFKIQSVNIQFGKEILPSYDIKLSNQKAETLKSELRKTKTNQSIVNSVVNNQVNKTSITNNIRNTTITNKITWQNL